ncbi:hypothetical protein ACHAXA_002281 [Cyclostephanos tholiformis]|uniref:BTB domain-containing protein n=1 Tax=Cyclostephanos tholiformis TaxID=382380 RepID=A0ABD3RDZ9_9STRA
MIPSITIPPSARDAAKETTEEVMKALDSKMRAFQSLYSQVSCTDLLAIKHQVADCVPLVGGGNDVALNWRSDPFLSMSDLTLNVYDGRDDGQPTPYYAHTLLLAHGGRKSCLVDEQVRSQRRRAGRNAAPGIVRRAAHDVLKRQNSNLSSNEGGGNGVIAEYRVDIHVPALAARHVPLFLDYVYGSSLRLTTSNAAPLRYLSNRFDCRDLHREVTSSFIPRDLNLSTAPRYCAMADELSDHELRDRAVRYMAERFDDIDIDALGCMVPRLMRRLLQCERLACDSSERVSEKVAEYLRLADYGMPSSDEDRTDRPAVSVINDGERGCRGIERVPSSSSSSSLTDEDFYWLTHCQIMPKISPREALFYLAHGARYPSVMVEIGSGSLKSRCIAACADPRVMDRLASHVERAGDAMNDPPLDAYDNMHTDMKVELLESMMIAARRMMAEKDRKYARREEMEREARLSDEIMYKSNEGISTSPIDDDGGGRGGEISKAVVLGCGVAPANGIYHSITPRKCRTSMSENDYNWLPGSHRRSRRGDAIGVDVVYERKAVWRGRRDWEVEDDDDEFVGGGLHPPPQFVGRVERPMPSGLNKSLMDSPSPERGGWVS